jgi:thiol-disulfide isomerase/thioredoxin
MRSKYVQPALLALALLVALAWYLYRQPNFGKGETVPDFSTVLMNGDTVRFESLRGRYVLLQFWGSWCGPCRKENPHLVELYHQYHNQGFEIFSIGIEQSAAAWQKAIARDGMVWPYHSADLRYFDGDIAKQFNIHSIPSTFLIDPEGKIVAVNPGAAEIGNILAQSGRHL